jgi:hypothetical protein
MKFAAVSMGESEVRHGGRTFFLWLNAPSGVGLVVVVIVALVSAAAVGQVSAAGRLESPIVAERLANIDFAQRVGVDRSGLPVPSIAVRDTSNLLVPAVGSRDKTVFRDLKLTLAKNGCGGWLK